MTARDLWIKPTTDQVIAALANARDLVSAGWVQNRAYALIDGQDCYCPAGAIAQACGTIRLDWPVMWGQRVEIMGRVVPGAWLRDAVTAAVMAALPPYTPTLAIFNDVRSRRQSEVILLFNTAIGIVLRKRAAA